MSFNRMPEYSRPWTFVKYTKAFISEKAEYEIQTENREIDMYGKR